jgi:dihydropyrimidinase
VVRGGRVVLDSAILDADIVIRDGRVVALLAPGEATGDDGLVLDAGGALVLPGGVDVHTHVALSLGDFATLDDFGSASRAAAFGGTTTFLEFAIPGDDETPLQAVERRLREADGVTHVDYGFHGCVARTADAVSLAHITQLGSMGVTSIKVFTAYRDMVMLSLDDIKAVMETSASAGSMVMVHAEAESVIDGSLDKLRSEGSMHARHHPRARPAEAEIEASTNILELARSTGCAVYLVHVTLAEVAEAIARARSDGSAAWGESCPHYLLLDERCYRSDQPERFVCSPPLRPAATAAELWSHLGRGLSGVHSDHCCFDLAQKSRQANDLTRIPPGVPGIETRLPLMISEALEDRISLTEVVSLCASAPASLFGIPHKGSLLPGYDGDLLIVDPSSHTDIRAGLHMSTDFSPFEGRRMKGRIDTVVSAGNVLVRSGEWASLPASGRFVRRRPMRERDYSAVQARSRSSP